MRIRFQFMYAAQFVWIHFLGYIVIVHLAYMNNFLYVLVFIRRRMAVDVDFVNAQRRWLFCRYAFKIFKNGTCQP